MNAMPNIGGGLAVEAQGLEALKRQARQSPDAALKQAAQQFESVFMNMMLRAMREATPQDGMFDSDQTRMFTGMLDQQLAQTMSARGVGLADVMVKQLSRGMAAMPKAVETSGASVGAQQIAPPSIPAAAPKATAMPSAYSESAQQAFVQKLMPHALQASQTSGIPAHLMLGQAALESGWGRREIKMADGSNSHNLFGIKAGAGWNGKVAEVMTTEYVNGAPVKQVEKFRAYGSYAEAFQDYARMLGSNPRYAGVVQQTEAAGFSMAMQRAGYATDPQYADKLARVIGKVSALG
jgi:flagellar protein FlgJ